MDIVDFISEERLKTYEDQTDRRERAIALHNQTLQLGSSLMSMIALFELALRNSTNMRIAANRKRERSKKPLSMQGKRLMQSLVTKKKGT